MGLSERKREVLSEIRRENHDVVVLTETKLRGVGEEELEDYFHFYSGINNGNARAGVSILLKKQLAIDLKWKSVSERLIVAEFRICEKTVVVIGVYWLDNCVKPATLRDAFRDKLRSVIENVDEKHELIILGDFNSRVGVDQSSCVVGKYGDPVINKNGSTLVEMCKDLNLKVQNTFFKHEDKHKFTWYHSVQPLRSLIDFCITRQDPAFIVDDVIACRWMNCKSDHVFLEATLSFEIPNIGDVSEQPEGNSVPKKYRIYLLYSKQIRNSYKDYLNAEIDVTGSRTTNEIYQCLKDSIHSAASFVLGKETNNNYGEFLWDQEVRDLQEFRQRNRYQSEASKLYLGMDINESLLKNIKNEVWEGICSEINSTHKCRKNKIVWDIINDIQNKPPRTFEMHSEHLVSDLNFKHSTELNFSANELNIFNNQHQESLLNINIRDIDTALNHLEDLNVPVPGGLTIKLLKHSSKKAKVLLTKLIQNIFNGEEIPKEISEMYCIYNALNNGEFLLQHNKYSCHSIMRVMRVIVNNVLSLNLNVKCMKYLSNEEIDIDGTKIKGTEIVHFNNFVLECDGRNVEEIFQRVFDAREAIGTLHPVARDKMITKENKKRIFKSVIRNLLVYGCENWTMTKDLKDLLEDTELNYWKWCCENHPQRYSEKEIHGLMNVKDTVYNTVMLKKAAWYTHIMDADRKSWLRQVMDWEPDGVLKCGRPRKKWMEGLEDFLNSFRNYQIYFQKKKELVCQSFIRI
ncbi:hypothetical protein JTE90_004559 [Oedothorax gibbosus]|uniref:Endonuclease/exonuclease/phosphatase domain-containing protein n=1 Tax=Oedothorax gibbosus TaxID=931172 RepID=A0AAV6UJ22_9ARAC|nr:hypothetical protein JTE90_004559 [Oedothorax gibbosus]